MLAKAKGHRGYKMRALETLRDAANRTPEEVDAAALLYPFAALQYAAQYLSARRLNWCATKWPYYALAYAAQYLTPERLARCAERRPRTALRYAVTYLTPDTRLECEVRAALERLAP